VRDGSGSESLITLPVRRREARTGPGTGGREYDDRDAYERIRAAGARDTPMLDGRRCIAGAFP
jgi:hypothetical protein